jgi:hypothetical protein
MIQNLTLCLLSFDFCLRDVVMGVAPRGRVVMRPERAQPTPANGNTHAIITHAGRMHWPGGDDFTQPAPRPTPASGIARSDWGGESSLNVVSSM